jgi:O-antigen/teichoic acid export membrane protein
VVREASKAEERLPGLLWALVRLRGGLALICMVVVWTVALVFEAHLGLSLLVSLASLHLLFYSLGGFNAVFHVKMRFDFVALVAGIGHTLFLLISLGIYGMGSRNPALYLIAYGVGMAVSNLANVLFCRRFLPEGLRHQKSEMGALFREALPLGISTIMVTVYFYVDTVLLRALKGEAAVGYYNAAYRLLSFSLMVPVVFNQVIFPLFSRCMAEGDAGRARLRPIFRRAVLYMGLTGIPVMAALWIFSEPVIVLVCGETYRSSALTLGILGLAMAVIFLTYPHLSILVASGRQILFAWIAGAGGLLNVLLNLVLIPRFGIEGAAWATVITESLVLACALFCARRYAGLTAWHGELIKIPLATGAIVGAGFCVLSLPTIWALAVLALVFFLLLFIFRLLPFDLGDEDRH